MRIVVERFTYQGFVISQADTAPMIRLDTGFPKIRIKMLTVTGTSRSTVEVLGCRS